MTNRYFYTCPLKAAYMAKYFGMKFAHGDSFKSACEVASTDKLEKLPFEIADDSLPLLEPQVGVYAECEHSNPGWANPSGRRICVIDDLMLRYWDKNGRPDYFKILQRNGIAFLWPEQEKA